MISYSRHVFVIFLTSMALFFGNSSYAKQISNQNELVWQNDFNRQPITNRPSLEVRYTDGSREAFEILAQDYHLLGQLQKPHHLVDAETGQVWLEFSLLTDNDEKYFSRFSEKPSRINLYRRGPYFCEIHWLDITLANKNGKIAPLKGDLALYCYPEKILAAITWHAEDNFSANMFRVSGIIDRDFNLQDFNKEKTQIFSFPLYGEEAPLGDASLVTLDSETPLQYDTIRGCYTIGSYNPGAFQGHFFEYPNFYESVRFRFKNDSKPRTVYVCHETIKGAKGHVEGGTILDQDGFPLPVTVQISKNFSGEKEEKFYNPDDTPFSETYFPLVLAANESCTVSSLHLYQNWGRHMVKQFSSLGAWMDYFHSSTGVTETTCYVPFKFAGLPGVAIADFRAMSQSTFWAGQPQHDNIAGHSFLSYFDGEKWQYLAYRGTTYHSTGPNWMDICLDYLSTDGKINVSVRTFELPQKDELRNFIHVRCEVLEPLSIENAQENFRFLTAATWVQRLRYTHFSATGLDSRSLDYGTDHFAVRGFSLPTENAWCALYGENKGSNAFVLRNWTGPVGPAASVWCGRTGDSRLLLVPQDDQLDLQQGDVFEFDAIILPYGEIDGAKTPRQEAAYYGNQSPKILQMIKGEKGQDFPTIVMAHDNQAEFILQGGRDFVPVIFTGLTDYRWPRLFQKREHGWQELSHARVFQQDGIQVFCEENGTYGAVFLVASDNSPQQLKVSSGEKTNKNSKIQVKSLDKEQAALIQAPWMKKPMKLLFPYEISFHSHQPEPGLMSDAPISKIEDYHWTNSEAHSIWFQSDFDQKTIGGRLTPNEEDVDVEFWIGNSGKDTLDMNVMFESMLTGTIFADPHLERTWILDDSGWIKAVDLLPNKDRNIQQLDLDKRTMAVLSRDKKSVFSLVWPQNVSVTHKITGTNISANTTLVDCPSNRRIYVRTKLYLFRGTLNDLSKRIQREMTQ